MKDQALIYTKSHGVDKHDPRCGGLFHASLWKKAIHFAKKGTTKDSLLQMVHYNVRGEILSQLPRRANVMSSTSRLPRKELLYRNGSISKAEKGPVWKPEQKIVSWMKDLCPKLSRPGNVLRNFCAGTRFAAKACMFDVQHRTFEGCDADSEVLTTAEADLLLAFVFQMLSSRSVISVSAGGHAAAKVFKDGTAALLVNKNASV